MDFYRFSVPVFTDNLRRLSGLKETTSCSKFSLFIYRRSFSYK